MSRGARAATLLVFAAMFLPVAPRAKPPEDPPARAAEGTGSVDSGIARNCDELARQLEVLLSSAPDTTEVTRIEAEEIGRVADELFAEGDYELATMLFQEALALLTQPSSAP